LAFGNGLFSASKSPLLFYDANFQNTSLEISLIQPFCQKWSSLPLYISFFDAFLPFWIEATPSAESLRG